MAGETTKCEAICLSIRPWSQTSHVVSWLAPDGKIATSVKGAVRPKSAFLGQYDLNYTCEIVYYARAHGDIHALRECTPLSMREELRGDFRALAVAGYFRSIVERFAPHGEECEEWHTLLAEALDRLCAGVASPEAAVSELLFFDMKALSLMGLRPEIESLSGSFAVRGERSLPVSKDVAALLCAAARSSAPVPSALQVALDATRVIGIYYTIHLDLPPDARRAVLGLVSRTAKKG